MDECLDFLPKVTLNCKSFLHQGNEETVLYSSTGTNERDMKETFFSSSAKGSEQGKTHPLLAPRSRQATVYCSGQFT